MLLPCNSHNLNEDLAIYTNICWRKEQKLDQILTRLEYQVSKTFQINSVMETSQMSCNQSLPKESLRTLREVKALCICSGFSVFSLYAETCTKGGERANLLLQTVVSSTSRRKRKNYQTQGLGVHYFWTVTKDSCLSLQHFLIACKHFDVNRCKHNR